MNIPFGFGGFGGFGGNGGGGRTNYMPRNRNGGQPGRGKPALMADGDPADPAPKRKSVWDPKKIKWALRNAGGSGLGGIWGALGLPWQQKRGGMWMTIDPRMRSVYPSGSTPYPGGGNNPPPTGGEDPPVDDPNNPPDGVDGSGGIDPRLLQLLFPPEIGTGAQWRNTMKYGA